MKKQKLKSLYINVEEGIYQLNGKNIGDSTTELSLEFKDGKWSLAVTRDLLYTANGKS